MRNKLMKRLAIIIASVALLAFTIGDAVAVTNSSSVVSPYWQSDTDVYTFVAVTHSSLAGTNSEIGVVLNVLTEDSSTTFGTSAFTVTNADTRRVFIVSTNHSTINSTSVTSTDTVFITGTTSASSGSLVFTPRSSNPLVSRESGTNLGTQTTDVTSLSYWGAIVISSTNSGFAMEFIGDTHDSLFNTLTVTAGRIQKGFGIN
jgi:hypothetical protein